jgi:hypothetical protein
MVTNVSEECIASIFRTQVTTYKTTRHQSSELSQTTACNILDFIAIHIKHEKRMSKLLPRDRSGSGRNTDNKIPWTVLKQKQNGKYYYNFKHTYFRNAFVSTLRTSVPWCLITRYSLCCLSRLSLHCYDNGYEEHCCNNHLASQCCGELVLKRSLRIWRRKWNDNVKLDLRQTCCDLRQTCCEGRRCMELTHYRVHWELLWY